MDKRVFITTGDDTFEIITEIDENGRKRGRIVQAERIETPCDVVVAGLPDGATVVSAIERPKTFDEELNENPHLTPLARRIIKWAHS